MQILKTLKAAGALVLVMSSFSALAADAPATVPASFQGTYDLTFESESSKAPFADGARVTMVVMPGNQLCIAGLLLTNPVTRNNNPHEAIWMHAASKIEVALSSLVTGYNEVNLSEGVLGTSSFVFLGQLRGNKINSSTTCTSAPPAPEPTISAAAQSMFDLAAQVYPTLLVNGSALGLYEGYVYRFFAASGIYVGIKDDTVFTLGGPFGNVITSQGKVAAVLSALQAAKAQIDQSNNNPLPTGLYNLTVTGRVTMMGFAVDIPEIKLLNLPAPQPTDTGALADTVKTSLGATGFAVSKVTVINNSANRVTFRLEATATAQGVSVTYDLLYDYTR